MATTGDICRNCGSDIDPDLIAPTLEWVARYETAKDAYEADPDNKEWLRSLPQAFEHTDEHRQLMREQPPFVDLCRECGGDGVL